MKDKHPNFEDLMHNNWDIWKWKIRITQIFWTPFILGIKERGNPLCDVYLIVSTRPDVPTGKQKLVILVNNCVIILSNWLRVAT